MRERATFLKPIAHRGLHTPANGLVENSAAAFEAAIAKGYGVEADVRPSACSTPMIFHDDTLERLIEGRDAVRAHDAATLKSFKYRSDPSPMIDFAELLELVDGREPVLAEIKSDWKPPDLPFLQSIAELASSYRGPIALVSYDPDVIAVVKELVPQIPRGIVSGLYEVLDHWHGRLEQERAFRLSHLLESRDAAPDFYAYHVESLPTPVTRFVREIVGLPFFAWTVRTPEDREIAARWADAPIFEDYEP